MSNLIIAESHRAISDPIKKALGLRCLSATFLPAFSQSTKMEVARTEHFFIKTSNPKALQLDGISKYEIEKLFTKKYFNNIIPMILDIDNGKDIILAQDNDAGGNFMASLLYYKLISNGIEKKRIKRLLGIERVSRDGRYAIDLYFGLFMPFELVIRILERYRIEQKSIGAFRSIDRRIGKGFRNIVALNEALEKSYYEDTIMRNSEGVSLATYFTKQALDEK